MFWDDFKDACILFLEVNTRLPLVLLLSSSKSFSVKSWTVECLVVLKGKCLDLIGNILVAVSVGLRLRSRLDLLMVVLSVLSGVTVLSKCV
jgi:hypothetical protein